MVEAAIARNSRDGITGILHRESDTYFQWLEGTQEAVEKVYSSIEHDSRHNHVECLVRGPIANRIFSRWSMAYSNYDEESLFDWAAENEVSLRTPDPQDILEFLTRRGERLQHPIDP